MRTFYAALMVFLARGKYPGPCDEPGGSVILKCSEGGCVLKWGASLWLVLFPNVEWDVEDQNSCVLLFAHGSRVEEANQGVRALAQRVQDSGSFACVRAAFLELGQPDLKGAIAEAVGAGARRIIVVPYFLTMGIHLQRDLPKLLAREKELYPAVEFLVSESLEGHPVMPSLLVERIRDTTKTGGRVR